MKLFVLIGILSVLGSILGVGAYFVRQHKADLAHARSLQERIATDEQSVYSGYAAQPSPVHGLGGQ